MVGVALALYNVIRQVNEINLNKSLINKSKKASSLLSCEQINSMNFKIKSLLSV
jgi:hypothetical protein